MTADYDRALDAKAELVGWWRKPRHQEYGQRMAAAAVVDDWTEAHKQELAWVWARKQAKEIDASPPYFVTSDMVDLTRAAAKVMPSEAFLPSDPPSPSGFVYLASSIHVDEGYSEIPFRAFMWRRVYDDDREEGTEVVYYADRQAIFDYVASGQAEGRMTTVPMPRKKGLAEWRRFVAPLVLGHIMHFSDGVPFEDEGGRALLGPFVKAFWTISQQRLVHVTEAGASRATLRRLERDEIEISAIRVVNLRRRDNVPAPDTEGLHLVDWSHRWIVEGHWRNQYLPSVQAHRLQWISAYIKGPEDKPLVVKDTVFWVSR
jgi:hypothetical protein